METVALERWTDFAVVVGGASAALTGLLFVAISINVGTIGRSISLRSRGGQTLVLFVVTLVVSIVLAVPDQGFRAFGVELLVLVAIAGAGLLALDRRAKREAQTPALARTLDYASPNVATLLLIAAAGVVVLTGHGWGLYLLVLSTVVAIVGGVANAWLFLTQLGE
ncbi:hypothetical protein [Actinomycetospora sp. TBRC 11914]|uniref:hypothetical protein n=1 Tax=Actinomycetospora sp. TBRC 11914 TaxID=2729387 RepID=UPI00145D0ADB|nr:hypothetical protein [Actinomycetospora sp. TBRC 11914]NMO92612.1 hypothetical protein [Actinomycetospora sp. TBRC 11914]